MEKINPMIMMKSEMQAKVAWVFVKPAKLMRLIK